MAQVNDEELKYAIMRGLWFHSHRENLSRERYEEIRKVGRDSPFNTQTEFVAGNVHAPYWLAGCNRLLRRDLMKERPDWKKVYSGCVPPLDIERAQETVVVTREAARLALSALQESGERDYYHNSGAAAGEIRDALQENDLLRVQRDALYHYVNGLLGLLQLICGRDDMPASVRDVLHTNHRAKDAADYIAQIEPPTANAS